MKQTTLTQRLLSALVALCMVLSVCAPALAANSSFIWIQKSSGYPTPVTSDNIGTLLPGYSIAYNGNTVTITMGSGQHTQELEGVTLIGGGQDLVLCTAGTNWMTDTSSSSNIGLTITGMKNVTVTPAEGSSIGFLGSLKIVDCTGDVNIQNSSYAAVVGRLEVDNSAGHGGSVTITENCDRADWGTYLPYGMIITSNGDVKIENKNGCAVCGSLEIKESDSVDIKGTATNGRAAILGSATISSNGAVRIENQTSNDWKAGAAVGYKDNPNITGTIFFVEKSASVEVIGAGVNPTLGGEAIIRSSGDVSITNSLGGSAVGNGLIVTTGGAVTVKGDNAAAIKGKATITAGRNVSIQNISGIAVEGKLIVNSSTGVTVTGRRASAPIITGSSTIKNTNNVEIINKDTSGRTAQNITYTPPAGMGSVYYTSSASKAEKHYARNTDDKYYASEAYFRIESAALYTLTLPDGVTAKTNDISDTRFYAGEKVTVTAPKDTDTKKFKQWTFSGTEPTGLPDGWQNSKEFTFKMPEGNVTLTADYKQLYNLTVTGGTIVGGNGDTGNYLPGTEVTVAFTGSTSIEDQFEKWTLSGTKPTDLPNDWQSKPSFSFTMPAGNVTLKAECKTVYNVSVADSRGTVLVNNEERSRALEGETVTVKASDTFFDAYREFDGWKLTSSTPLVRPSDNWENSKEFTFTMPAGDVALTADYKQLYDLTVKGGTIVNGTDTGIYLPGTEVTIQFTDSDDITKQFKQWKSTDTEPEAPRDGWPEGGWQTNPEFTFKMPAGDVTLEAEYRTVYNVSVDENRGTVLVNDEKRTQALEGETVTVKASDTFFDAYHEFDGWQLSGDSAAPVNPSEGWKTSKTFTFKMPAGNVTLKADCKQLYDLTVTGGTIVDGNGDTGIYLPGDEVTVVFDDSHDIAKQFKQWKSTDTEPEAPTAGWPEGGWQNSKKFTFKMPTGNVTLEAEYKTVYNVSVDENRGTVLVNDEKRTQALEGETVTVKASDTFFDAYHEFDGWKFTSGTEPTGLPDGWQTSKEFTFKMPAGNVALTADYKQLYDLTVNGGTIVDESSDTGKPSGIYLPGTEVTIQFTDSDDITKQFKQWTYTGTAPEEPDGGWQTSKTFTFKMPAGNVSLSADYRKTYLIFETAGKAEFFAEGAEEQNIYEALPGTRIIAKVLDSELNDHRQFNMWRLGDISMELVNPEDGWQNKPSFSFAMPEGDVELQAYFTTLYDVNVTHGTIEGGTDDNGTSQKIVKPGQLVTVRAESTEENPFLRWNSTSEAPVEPDDGWPDGDWQTSKEFTFKMPEGNVTLEAQRDQLYKVSINDSLGSVTINGEPRSSLWVKGGETVTVATTLKDGYWMEFMKWTAQDGSAAPVEPSDNWQTSTTFTFKMPNGPVELVAQWSASSLDPDQHIDPDEPIDEDFGVEPAPMDTTGGTIAAVAVGGAAIWGGYEIATRVILHSLLPEGTAIPASRGQLALLVWNTAGRPEPAGAPAFADVTDPDMAKAAQWCTEQGTMAAKGDRFEPEGWTPKFKVIEVWNKAFPAA